MIERKTDWKLRKATPEDKQNLKAFFKTNLWLTKDNAQELYEWKYAQNPAGDTLALIGVNSENKIIATSMFMPWRLQMNGNIIKACQWVDLFVEPEYRGQPLPSLTLEKGLEEFTKNGAAVCFAFPNDNSIPIHKKNNGLHLGFIKRYTKPLDSKYLVNRRLKWRFGAVIMSFFANLILRLFSKDTYFFNLNGFAVKKVEECGLEFDDLWETFTKVSNGKIMACKNSAYLNWKHLNNPNKNRQIYALKNRNILAGFVVLESTASIGYIIDILAISRDILNYLIAFSIKYFRKKNKDSIVFTALENNMYFPHFKSFGFVERPEIKHFYIYLDEDMADKEYFRDSKNWVITIGDCDVEGL